MKTYLAKELVTFDSIKQPGFRPACFPIKLGLAALAIILALTSAHAQVQTAGTLLINVDATGLAAGPLVNNDIANAGSLGGVFESTNKSSIASIGGVNALVLGGTNYLWLTNRASGGLIAPPSASPSIVGPNATCSIEVWAFNPQVADNETMIAWGSRGLGQNMAFEYGYNGNFGAAEHTADTGISYLTPNNFDLGWDFNGGCPLNTNWHHLVYTCDGTTQSVYADGALVNSRAAGFNIVTNASITLGCQWTNTTGGGTGIGTSPGFATLSLAKVRVHSGALTAAQVLNNFTVEQSAFIPAAPAPAFLAFGPTHRYSFSETPTNDATGLAIHDSIGSANGVVQSSELNQVAQFTGRRLATFGTIQASNITYGAAYADLPNGLVSANSTNNGGSGEFSIEVWYKNYYKSGSSAASTSPQWSRVFDIGSCGTTSGGSAQQGVEVSSPGNYPAGGAQLDYFIYSAQVGASVNQRQLGWQNKDIYGTAGSVIGATNNGAVTVNVETMGTVATDRHVVVTWKESTGQIIAYENGLQVATITVLTNMSALNDINVWLGRSQSGTDWGLYGEYDEARIYSNVLSSGQVLGNFQVGPGTINTGPQAAAILTQPQNLTASQGWPASFYVETSGSPAVSYQWSRNGAPIPGATADTYALAATSSTNNGDTYSCTVSNFANAIPNTQTSTLVTLTVSPNVVPPPAALHETKDAWAAASAITDRSHERDDYDGTVGGIFQVGAAGALVTHLGFYDVNNDGLLRSGGHTVTLYPGNAAATPIAQVVVPAGVDPSTYLTNGYRYVALPQPLLLAPNSNYILQADTYNNDGDMWPDVWIPALWNPYFVGANGPSTRQARFGSHGGPDTGGSSVNGMYGEVNLASLPLGPPTIAFAITNYLQYVGQSLTIPAAVNGQAPLNVQWFKSPSTIPGQTGTSLSFASLALTDSGTYFLRGTNSLGNTQSVNVVLTVLAPTPVSISQQPTNLTVPQGYPAAFYIVTGGTPPIYYQWRRNSNPIAGATNSIYSIAAASLTNNGDVYSCVVSNFTTVPSSQTSGNATLTVLPNVASVTETLFPSISGFRDNNGGLVGGVFVVGSSPALVTHLGYYCTNGQSLNMNHHVGIFSLNSGTIPLASVTVPAGPQTNIVDNYSYIPLDTPLVLSANTPYILSMEVFNLSGDPWPDLFVPTPWNPYYIGSTATTTRSALYSGFNDVWPLAPYTVNGNNNIYGPGNLALLAEGPPVILMLQTNVYQYATSNITFSALVNGLAPLTVQWYKVGSPDVPLSGQTSTTLTLANLALTDSGTYYLVGNNSQGPGTNSVVLTVLAAGPPTISQQPQSQVAYVNQQVPFTVSTFTTPVTYQWTHAGTNLAGANASSYIATAGAATIGAYRVVVANNYGSVTSTVATLTLQSGAASAALLAENPLVYYRFSDVGVGTTTPNFGNLGPGFAGSYEGNTNAAPGPQPPAWPNFEANNQALVLDGSTVDVTIPALNLPTNTGPNITLAAWINSQNSDIVNNQYGGIIFNRPLGLPGGTASGLDVQYDTSSANFMLGYHWNNSYFGYASRLDVPLGQWAFVALAIDPAKAVFYLNDGTGMQSATNVAAHAAVPFAGTTFIGWDDNDATQGRTITRRFNGSIDEPMIFNRTLSPNEITALYQAGVGPVQLQISLVGGNVVLTWPRGVLQQSSQAGSGYGDTAFTSPYTNSPAGMTFYRVRVP